MSTIVASPRVHRPLHDGWTVRAAGGPAELAHERIPASVPGVVHLDLLDAGLIPDPFLDDNESKLAWIGLVDWMYESTFIVTADALAASERHELVFDGIDTVATVLLNGQAIAEVANQHRTYRFDVTESLVVGANTLVVAFRSPIRYANAQSVALGVRPRAYPLPFDAIRKSACSFGWDWGIATYSSGLWRPVALESWSGARLDQLLVTATPDGDGGVVAIDLTLARAHDRPVTVTITVAGVSVSAEVAGSTGRVELSLETVDRWWPTGYGDQPLYDVEITLEDSGVVTDSAARRVGFRTIRWDQEPDAAGIPFQLVVNDQPVFVKGVNWIPDDPFPSRIDRDRYRTRLEQARAANLNLIRVWGGGIYESEDFYDVCDELGLLTWQDMLFACAAYAEEEPLRSEVAAEARDNIARLAHRASLVLLTGNNENLWAYEDWGWKLGLDGKTWGAYYYYELFPQIVAELSSHVPYAPGSPFSPDEQHPNAETVGTMHLWEQWNRKDWPTYRNQKPRFVAEFGWQGPPTWSTLTASISDDPLTPESPGMLVHQKAPEGNTKLTNGLLPHYRMPEDIETWHWAMQLNQANAVSCALDWFRAHAPHTSGGVVWQLNDCWPVTSWAAIDGAGREKPLFFGIKNSFAPRVVSVQPGDDGLFVALTNDTAEAWAGDVVFRRLDFDGSELAAATAAVAVDERGTVRLAVPAAVAAVTNVASELVVVEALGVRGLWFFAEPRDSALAAAQLSVTARDVGDSGTAFTITTDVLVRDLALLVDKLDPLAAVDSGLITLLPGESHTFVVVGNVAADDVLRAEIARSGNQLVAGF